MTTTALDESSADPAAAVDQRAPGESPRRPDRARRGPLIVLLVIAVAAGGAVLWHKVIRDHVFPKNFGVVVDGHIYRSGQNTPGVLRGMAEDLELRTIIDLGGMCDAPETLAERALAEELGIKRYEFGLLGDGTGDPDRWAAVQRLLADERNHPVLVHCAAGAQRTSTAVILYRNLVEGRPIVEAYPESFEHEHEPDEWILLAFVTDHIDEIRRAFESGAPGTADAATLDEFAEAFVVNPGN